MILKSKTNTFGFWLTVIASVTVIFLILFFHRFAEVPLPGEAFGYFVFIVGETLWLKILWDNNKLIIDTELKTISFKNRITQKSSIHAFDDFDGYILIDEPVGGYSKSLYLVKDKIFVHKMTSFIYSNYEELKDNLALIPFLGKLQFSTWRTLKIAFGFPVLK